MTNTSERQTTYPGSLNSAYDRANAPVVSPVLADLITQRDAQSVYASHAASSISAGGSLRERMVTAAIVRWRASNPDSDVGVSSAPAPREP